MLRKYRNTVLALSLVLLSACTAIEKSPYPADWPPVGLAAKDCAVVNGIYSNAAERQTYQHPHNDVMLALALLPPGEPVTQTARVALEYGDEGCLLVHALAEDGAVLIERRYRMGEGFVRCEEGVLILNPAKMPERVSAPDNPLVGISSSRIELYKAQDGSLIMRESGSATGMAFLLVPMHMQSEEWYLFRLWRDNK